MLVFLNPVIFQNIHVEGIAAVAAVVSYRVDVMALTTPFQRQEDKRARQRGIRQCSRGESGKSVFVKIPPEGMAARFFQDGFGAQKQLLMLHLLFPKAEQRSQVRAVRVPVLSGEAREVDRDEFLIVAKQMDIAEGPQMVERALFALIEERNVLSAHPRVGDNAF